MNDAPEAPALRCGHCGAPVSRGDRLCGHCQAELPTVRCGSCFALAHAGNKLCGLCGAVLELEGQLGHTGRACPRCQTSELTALHVGVHTVEECLACAGLFVDHVVLERVTRQSELDAGIRLRPLEAAPPVPDTTRYLSCPTCGKHMNRIRFGERSDIVVDSCREHGVWFDRDELPRALEFVSAGGLRPASSRARHEAIVRRMNAGKVDPSTLPSYDMVGSFLASLFRR